MTIKLRHMPSILCNPIARIPFSKTLSNSKTAAQQVSKLCAIGVISAVTLMSISGCQLNDETNVDPIPSKPDPILADTSSTEDCIEDPLDSGYCLVWADEFNATSIDGTKWSPEINCHGGGNDEAQCYVDSPNNIWADGEYLHIKAIREDATGPNHFDDNPNYDPNDTSGTGTYTSGRLRSKNKGEWKYGRFEMRAQLPSGQGSWPAFWMLPTDNTYGGWPLSGEIDIMEAVNLKVGGENRTHGTLHYGDEWPKNVYSGNEYILPDGSNPADGFHTYAVEWEEGEIRWYVDGDHFATQTSAGWYTTAALDNPTAPFDQRFHLIMNLAVGGNWAANVNDGGIDESAFPQEFIIDYVRVYQCTRNPTNGVGCATTDDDYIFNEGNEVPTKLVLEGDSVTVFDGTALDNAWDWGTYTEGGTIAFENVTADDSNFGDVGQITFNTNNGIGFFQSSEIVDASAFNFIEFDILVVTDPRATPGSLFFRADCSWPCTSGDQDIGYPGVGVWTHYKLSLSDLAASGLNIDEINTPLVISTSWGNQEGVVLQIDNIMFTQ